MTQEELMIGDWVKVVPFHEEKKSYYKRIDSARDLDIILDFQDIVEPVPISAENLIDNRFIKRESPGYPEHFSYELSTEHMVFKLFALNNSDFSFNINECAMNIKYIHELQHALRLCKIDKEIKL